MRYRFGETVTRRPWLSDSAPDPYGRTRPVYGPDVAVPGAGVALDIVTELREGGSERQVVIAWLYLDFNQPAGEHDQWIVRGDLYEVDGIPLRERSPLTGWRPGCVVKCRRVTG